jgi:regulatory protein
MSDRRSDRNADARREPTDPTPDSVLPGIVTSIAGQARRADRVNVFVDSEFCFAARAEVVSQLGIVEGSLLTLELRARALDEDAFKSAYSVSLDLLARRARSVREISDRLRQKSFAGPTVERVLQRLREQGYVDDDAFARFWVENRTSYRPRGTRALQQELRAKGISSEIAGDAIANAEIDESAIALELARKRLASLEGLDPLVRKRRLMGFLQRRGFSYGVIRYTLEQLAVDESEGADDEKAEGDFG